MEDREHPNPRLRGKFWEKKVHPISGFYFNSYSEDSAALAAAERKKERLAQGKFK